MTREQWLGIAIAAITIVFTLMLLALLADVEGKGPDCVDPIERERLRGISLTAIDKGLDGAIVRLFDIWQLNPSIEQPTRAQTGMGNALNAHARARKFALDWNPPTCPQ